MNPADCPFDKRFTFWVTLSENPVSNVEYVDAIKYIATVGNVSEFWGVYSYLVRPDNLPPNTEYHLFQEGIRPMWEDEANQKGARWILRLRKGSTSAFWEELLLCVIGEQFDVTNEICGVAVSVRAHEDIISVWVRSGSDVAIKNSVRETLNKIWKLHNSVYLEYKEHPNNQRPPPKGRFNS